MTSATKTGKWTGSLTLLRFMLRRDRVRFWAWPGGLAIMALVFAENLSARFPNPESLQDFGTMLANPAGALFLGPTPANLTVASLLGGGYGLYLIAGGALMALQTVTRHTRCEEQLGRGELIRANVVGRHAQLAAALALAVLMCLLTMVMTAAVLTGLGYGLPGALAYGAAVGGAGLAFVGISAVTVQLFEFSRAAAGLAGTILGAGFLLRGLGDMSTVQGGSLGWLGWLTPLGWSQRVEPLTGNHFAPLGLAVAGLVVGAWVGFALSARRDLGAGLVPTRLGPAQAPDWIGKPWSVALRLQRGNLIGWGVAMVATGSSYGVFAGAIAEGLGPDSSPEILDLLGGKDDLSAGYIGLLGFIFGLVVAIFAVLAANAVKTEETAGRAEAVLATAVSRPAWLGAWTWLTALAAAALLTLAGIGTGIGVLISTGSPGSAAQAILGSLVQAPAVWVVLALANLLYAIGPRLISLTWLLVTLCGVLGIFGPMLSIPAWAMHLSPFEAIGRYPGGTISVPGLVLLAAIAAALSAAGLAVFRRRDLVNAG